MELAIEILRQELKITMALAGLVLFLFFFVCVAESLADGCLGVGLLARYRDLICLSCVRMVNCASYESWSCVSRILVYPQAVLIVLDGV